jgi:PAS domain S-box-containing protein
MNMRNHPIRVLLIDDDEDDYMVVRDLLSDLYSIEFILKWVSDYGAALDAILSSEFDVCLLDYRLKERNGLELMQDAVSRGAMTPIVFLTGQGGYDLDLEAMNKGAADWLTKGELSATLLERSIRYAMEQQRKREDLIKAKRVIQALSECNHAVIHVDDELELLRAICRIVVDVGGYRMAWVGYAEEDGDQTVTPIAKYGYEKAYLETVKVTWQDAERGKGPTGICIRTGFPSIIRAVGSQTEFAPWKAEAAKRGYASVIGLPLFLDKRKLGALTIYSSETDSFDAEEVEFLMKLSSNLSYGIGTLRLRKAQALSEESLKEANLDLEKRVEERRQAEHALRVSLRFLEIVHEHTDIAPLLREYVSEIKNYTGCDAVGIRVLDENGNIPYVAYQGFSRKFCELESSLCLKTDECMCINVIRGDVDPGLPFYTEGGGVCVNAISRFPTTVSEEENGRTRSRCYQEGYETVALFPFSSGGKIFGLIHVADHREHMVPPNVVKMLEKAAMQLGTAFQRARTESRLRESEEQFRTLVESAPDAIFIQMDGCFAYVNDAATRLYGAASEKELLGHDIVERVHPDYRGSVLERIRSVNQERKPGPAMEQKHLKLNGMTIDVEAIASPIRFHKSEGALVFVRDVTERKQIEESLLLSEERYRRLFEDAVLGIYRSTPGGEIINVNPAYARMYGFDSPEEAKRLVNDEAVDLYVDPSCRNEIVNIILNAKGPICAENLYKRKDGSTFTGNLHAWAARDREGKLLYLEGFIEDITERKRAEEALRESKAYLAATIESIPFEFWVMGPNGCYSMQNRICRGSYGDITGKKPEDVCPNETILSSWQDNNRRAFAGELVKGEVRYVLGSEELHFYNVVAPIHDGDRTLGIVGINVDITDRKLLEAALKKVNEELESQVKERTKELDAKTRHLEEFNAALKVLLKQREEDRTELEESILLNVKSLIVPYVEKLKKSRLCGDQMTYLTILESHMREITSPFTKRLSEKYLGLTPVEVQAAGLIKEGKTTKEIAESLGVAENTVSSNRFHIRKKLGLTNKKVNLRYYLNSLAK